jgi:BolA family transcriptional regulator, general stress-responsive regulator
MANTDTLRRIEQTLRGALAPSALTLEDESHLHRGHAGAQSGRGHFKVRLVADAFAGKTLIARHRLVYQALGSLMETDIHALSIEALSPDEA